MRSRSGFTLVELLVSLILFVMVGGSIYQILNVSQRAARTQTERGAMQSGVRTGIQVAISELQELWTDSDAGESAITDISSDTKITYFGMRGLGFTCAQTTMTQITIRAATYSDARGFTWPVTTDRVWLFVDNDPNKDNDDAWVFTPINSRTSGTCADGTTAIVLHVPDMSAKIGSIDWVLEPGPIRTDELMELGLVTVDGRDWLGIGRAAAGQDLTPLAGPLVTNGLDFDYMTPGNTAAGTVSDVGSIIMTLQAETDRAANRGISSTTQLLSDTVRVRVQLRNGR
jgi:prepilin-type N-terminal cleavage/methylation domain-containing protein